jgi:2-succinyl-6-hydroxy-2,4-cyclohexadiene-1-carboxylate synthase
MLHADIDGSGRRLVLVHGFTQTRRSWGPLVERLITRHELVLVDAPGHGRSGHVRADLWEGARLLGDVGGRADYLGYSMGGRYLLHLALARPDLVERLVLVGATAGIEDAAARLERQQGDAQWAQLVVDEGVERFLDRWLAGPLFRGLSPAAAGREARLENTATGLASSLRLAGTGRQAPLWDRLHELAMPVLLVVGSEDGKFRAVAERMQAAIGDNASVAVVGRAGHAAHLERPDAFAELLLSFLHRD